MNNVSAYHGTIKRISIKIVSEHRFVHSRKDNEWLGSGVYFFQHLYHAWQWADKQVLRKKYAKAEEPAVISVDLLYEEADILDLDDPYQKLRLDDFFSKLMEYIGADYEELTGDKDVLNKRRCLACNMYCQANDDVKLISYTFRFPDKNRNSTYYIYDLMQRQICVKDDSIIQNIREVDRDGKEIN